MTRKLPLGILCIAIILSAAAALTAKPSEERPAFVPEEQWISLGANAGLYITHSPDPRKAAIWLNGNPADEARSQLWVKVKGNWVPAHLEQAGGRIVPAT